MPNYYFLLAAILLIFIYPGVLELIVSITINPLACLLSRSMRYKRWNGHDGFLYSDRPIATTKSHKLMEYLKSQGTDFFIEAKKARTTGSRYFIDEHTVKYIPEIEPTDDELGYGIEDFDLLSISKSFISKFKNG